MALHLNISRHRRRGRTLSVVSSPQTNRTYPEPTAPIEGSIQDISLRTRPLTTQLHEKTICTSWLHNTSPHQTEDRRTWDTQSDAGFSLGTSMEHHRCFRVYITRTRGTQISDTVFFKHQYITNPTVSPESHTVAAAHQLTIALQGNIPTGNKTAEALQKISKLFTKIAMAKK